MHMQHSLHPDNTVHKNKLENLEVKLEYNCRSAFIVNSDKTFIKQHGYNMINHHLIHYPAGKWVDI